jgi:hypothetical protein
MKSSSLMVPITLEYQQNPLELPYMSSMPHNNGVKTKCEDKTILNMKNPPKMKMQAEWVV